MNSPVLVSVVMPCYNAESTISESIKSVQDQSYSNIEIIVIDDGSTDDSAQKVATITEHDSRVILITQKNKGAAAARNAGIERSTGKYLCFLDSDDYWASTFIESMLDATIRNSAVLTYCGWQNIGIPGPGGNPFIPPDYTPEELRLKFIKSCAWPIHGVIIESNIVKSLNGFDESLSSCMDYDLWLRVVYKYSEHIVRHPEVLAFYRHHDGGQITKNKLRLALNHLKSQDNFIANNPEAINRYGKNKIKELTVGELLRRGYIAYWNRDLDTARSIFRIVMIRRYGTFKDWKYMLPSLLPRFIHVHLINFFEK